MALCLPLLVCAPACRRDAQAPPAQAPKQSVRATLAQDTLLGIAETRAAPGRPQADVTVLRGAVDATLDRPANQSLTVGTPAATVRAGREIVFQ